MNSGEMESLSSGCMILDGRQDLRRLSYNSNFPDINKVRRLTARSSVAWHKFTVFNAAHHTKDYIFKHLLSSLPGQDFLPVKFHIKGEDCVFYARDCAPAIEQLLRANLTVEIPKASPLVLMIELSTKEMVTIVSTSALMSNVVSKRFEPVNRSIDLSNFHNDKDLESSIYCALSIPKLLSEVLGMCSRTLVSLNLSNNGIRYMDASKLSLLTELKILNLSNNDLDISHLLPLKSLNIKDLTLDGNPLCSKFETELQYVNAVRSYVPGLYKLDGIALCETGAPRLVKYYLCVPAEHLIEQFITHYFSLYDSPHRVHLLGTYHPQALLSLTTSYLPNQSTSTNAKLTRYVTENRNLIRLSDFNKITKMLKKGPAEIIEMLCRLPNTAHDVKSFTVDLMFHSDRMALLSVTGVFREPANSNVSLRFFKRQFTLLAESPGGTVFHIVNEMMFVNNCTTAQARVAFKANTETNAPPYKVYLSCLGPRKLKRGEKREMIDTMTEITEMGRAWCRKCLMDVRWDIRAAFLLFSETYKSGYIPTNAFIKYK